jgi:hypothetical protein
MIEELSSADVAQALGLTPNHVAVTSLRVSSSHTFHPALV